MHLAIPLNETVAHVERSRPWRVVFSQFRAWTKCTEETGQKRALYLVCSGLT
jgi:hypothetical protein